LKDGLRARLRHAHRGAALVEALVATLVLASGAAVMASLFAAATSHVRQSRDADAASRLASQKLEELLSAPATPAPSPSSSLDRDEPGWFDRVDELGRPAVSGLYVRRWLVEPAGSGAVLVTASVHHAAEPGLPRVLSALRR
jgi:hypothetical protein